MPAPIQPHPHSLPRTLPCTANSHPTPPPLPSPLPQSLPVVSVRITEHVSSPPPRYNDASLVKAMEELGIGRPSTYASTVAMLERRGYVHPRRGGRAPLVPTTLGRVTTEFLKEFFGQYVEYEASGAWVS